MGVSYNKMATVVPSLQLDFYFVVKLLALRVLQVGALIFVIIACLVFLLKALKVRAGLLVHGSVALGHAARACLVPRSSLGTLL